MPLDLKSLITSRLGENYRLHERHVNPTLVAVQRIIGFDVVYASARGALLFDRNGRDYLDLLSGYGVFNIGRNHPAVQQAIRDVLAMDLPNMVQMDCSLLSGLLAEALLRKLPPHLGAVFFCNSGAEAVEGAIKFARAATGRAGLVSLERSFHGLTHGALSVMGDPHFQENFGPLLAECARVSMNDLAALRARLSRGDVAAFIVEPVQGKGVLLPDGDFFRQAQQLCHETGTLLICDEVQTGLGRTGHWWGFEHWELEPDIVTVAKALSGGFVPCAAVVTRRAIHQRTFDRLDRCVVHSSTFGRNNLAMACGLATLQVIEEEGLVQNARAMGALWRERLEALCTRHSAIKEVRGLGMMLAIEFREPDELAARMGWKLLQKVEPGLFAQMVVTSLCTKHRILTMLAGHGMNVIKILPPLTIGEPEIERFTEALDSVLEECRQFPGPMWDFGASLVKHSLRRRAVEAAEAR